MALHVPEPAGPANSPRDSFDFTVGHAPTLVLYPGNGRAWCGTPQQLARHPQAAELIPDWAIKHVLIEEQPPERDERECKMHFQM